MKKTFLILTGILTISGIAASAQGVYSANALGYIRKTVPAQGKMACVTIPLNSLTEENNVFGRSTLAQQMPVNSTVYFWDPVSQGWSGGQKSNKGWSAGLSNRVVATGEGFFLKSPVDQATDIPITFAGEVPAEPTLSRAVVGGGALGTVGNPYPADFKFGTSSLAADASVNSTVYFWDPSSQGWSGGQKSSKGWSAGLSNRVVAATEGFFLKEAGAGKVWTTDKPYTWP